MTAKLRVAVVGAAGKMGTRLVEAVAAAPDLLLAARVDLGPRAEPGNEAGQAQGSFATGLFEFAAGGIDAVLEFTRGDAPARIGPDIERLGCPWISGTTGLTTASRAALEAASRKVPVLWSPNMSLGVALLNRLIQDAARLLPEAWEMEIVETHHAAKLDAPSGTALAMAELWTRARGGIAVHGRSGHAGPRPPREVGIHAVRMPEGVGEHRVLLGGPAESLELTHRALDRGAFVTGALTALRWIVGRDPGLYTLEHWVEERMR